MSEWTERDWRDALDCRPGRTVRVEPGDGVLVGACVDAGGARQGWSAEVSAPYGAPLRAEHWRDGLRDGLSVSYDAAAPSSHTGSPAIVVTYRRGVAHGSRHVFVDGRLREQVALRDGVRHGCSLTRHPTGAPFERGRFERGRRTGVWRTWRADGTPWARATFAAGRLVALERYRDGRWRPASPPPRARCGALARRLARALRVMPGGEAGRALARDDAADYADQCQLHMDDAAVDCALAARSPAELTACARGRAER